VASASFSCVVDVERRRSIQMDDAVAELKADSVGGCSAMMVLLGLTTEEVRSMRAEVAHLRGLTGGSLVRAVSGFAVGGSRGEASAGPLEVGGGL